MWCALSVKPFRIRDRIPEKYQFMAALLLTAVLMAPSCLRGFRLGLAPPSQANRTLLFTATTNCALAFFLASFQVHEKSLLLALAPASLLPDESLVRWFSLVTTWTLWPLLVVDRLQVAYFCIVGIFVGILLLKMELCASPPSGILNGPWLRWIPLATYALMASLHAAESLVEPGPALPDLFPVLWSVAGCGLCGIAYLLTAWKLFTGPVKIKDV
jgi:alpha-1,3-glucosyltransferase